MGLAGLSIEKSAEKEAIEQDVGIIKQVGKNMMINDAHLKVFWGEEGRKQKAEKKGGVFYNYESSMKSQNF